VLRRLGAARQLVKQTRKIELDGLWVEAFKSQILAHQLGCFFNKTQVLALENFGLLAKNFDIWFVTYEHVFMIGKFSIMLCRDDGKTTFF
jgi:hypothetical protein